MVWFGHVFRGEIQSFDISTAAKEKPTMVGRLIGTICALFAYGVVMMIYTPQAALVTSKVAGRQFETSSDAAYLQATYVSSFFSTVTVLLSVVLLVVLILIWAKPIAKAAGWVKDNAGQLVIAIAAGGALLFGTLAPSYAFFEKVDRTEVYPILPNQTAFWVPEIGDSRGGQAQTEDEAYWNSKKVQFTRFKVDHQLLKGTNGIGWGAGWSDYFVPTGRLIIVNREPVSREWLDAHDRGTSSKKEGFPCQTTEGLNVTVGLAVGASVRPEDAARFLYKFPLTVSDVKVKGTAESLEADGKVIYQSVYYSKSVAEVMDGFGRKKFSELICDEIMSRDFTKTNAEAKAIKNDVAKASIAFFKEYGITIDFMGWADTFTFDPDVQAAVNRRYVATQDLEIAKSLAPYTETIKALATAQAVRNFGEKTDGKLPATFMGMPPEIVGPLLGLPNTPRGAAPAAPK